MRTKERKQGISLIVLIVTIIVIIILAAVVILTLSKNNPIESAKEARIKEDIRTFQDELALYISKQYANAGGHWDGNISAKTYNEIINYIPSFTKKYEGKFVINNNNLEYTNKLDEKEKEYAQSLNVKERVKLLPDEYQQVEYIESVDSQYINTNYIPDINTNIEIEFVFLGGGNSSMDWIPICGERSSSRDTYFNFFIIKDGTRISPNYGNFDPGRSSGISPIEKNKRYNLKNDGGEFFLDNELKTSTTSTRIKGTTPIYIFAIGNQNSVDCRQINLKLYFFKLYTDNKIVRNFIPCYSITNVTNVDGVQVPANTKGLYDTVEGKFYTNQGTGEDFIPGPEV